MQQYYNSFTKVKEFRYYWTKLSIYMYVCCQELHIRNMVNFHPSFIPRQSSWLYSLLCLCCIDLLYRIGMYVIIVSYAMLGIFCTGCCMRNSVMILENHIIFKTGEIVAVIEVINVSSWLESMNSWMESLLVYFKKGYRLCSPLSL